MYKWLGWTENNATGANLMWEHATSNLQLFGASPHTHVCDDVLISLHVVPLQERFLNREWCDSQSK